MFSVGAKVKIVIDLSLFGIYDRRSYENKVFTVLEVLQHFNCLRLDTFKVIGNDFPTSIFLSTRS